MFLIDFDGSDNGITFDLNPEYPPVDGGLHCIEATFPDNISIERFEGGSGAVVMLAVQVNQSAKLEFE